MTSTARNRLPVAEEIENKLLKSSRTALQHWTIKMTRLGLFLLSVLMASTMRDSQKTHQTHSTFAKVATSSQWPTRDLLAPEVRCQPVIFCDCRVAEDCSDFLPQLHVGLHSRIVLLFLFVITTYSHLTTPRHVSCSDVHFRCLLLLQKLTSSGHP